MKHNFKFLSALIKLRLSHIMTFRLGFFGVISIPEKIQTGELDLYLTKPVNPLLRITFEKVDPGSLPLLILSICLLAYGVRESGTSLTCSNIFGYVVLVLLMTVLFYDMELLIRCFAFFIFSVNNLMKIENTVIDLCLKIPGIAFSGVSKIIFYCVLPYGMIATLPTQILMEAKVIVPSESCTLLILGVNSNSCALEK